ncbi:LysM peptidoglycan-binding domain-containing protein [Aureitalea marina]|uniref:LysM domain-containing protein n=1 Tax=Aureitalea marina TaxID=930804 RepID=A0A2S7KQB6_9FLAO|nr:LysM peptidoglycan-binding domain-containing protein [Aureitalea marina]PQB04763.1 hypothetical protein BST85_07535 [Aureitalea marina]
MGIIKNTRSLRLLACSLLLVSKLLAQYRSHTVQAGETVYSIAKQYNVSTASIYELNPEARSGVSLSEVLVIPEQQPVRFRKHKVKKKETLFSIAQRYDITEDDLKRYNKHLYSKPLKKGERLQIPIGLPKASENQVNTEISESNTANQAKHLVEPKETRYGIARMYGITVAELEALNPGMPENFPIGMELIVPEEKVTEESVIEDDRFDFYEVQPKEGFFRLKIKLGLSQEEIVALNPYAADGLKEGMILKIPKEEEGAATAFESTDLESYINNRDAKRLALMLPFQVPKFETDSVELRNAIMQDPRNNAARVALDFYSGALMAVDFAKDKGIAVRMDVYDTEGSVNAVSQIMSSNSFDGTQAVIGPLLKRNVEYVARELRSEGTPVFSPLSNRGIDLTSNTFQTLPDQGIMEKAMLDYIVAESAGKKMILITDGSRANQVAAIQAALPGIQLITPQEEGFIYQVHLEEKLAKELLENWVIIESTDPILVSNVIGLLNGMPTEEYAIRLFTLNKGDVFEFDDVSNMHLANLNFTFPAVSKPYDFEDKNAFLVSYQNRYGVLPNRYAVRGFDLTYDILLRLGTADDIYDGSGPNVATEYVENRFQYNKKMFSGYRNQAFFLLKYNQDLNLEIIK